MNRGIHRSQIGRRACQCQDCQCHKLGVLAVAWWESRPGLLGLFDRFRTQRSAIVCVDCAATHISALVRAAQPGRQWRRTP